MKTWERSILKFCFKCVQAGAKGSVWTAKRKTAMTLPTTERGGPWCPTPGKEDLDRLFPPSWTALTTLDCHLGNTHCALPHNQTFEHAVPWATMPFPTHPHISTCLGCDHSNATLPEPSCEPWHFPELRNCIPVYSLVCFVSWSPRPDPMISLGLGWRKR